MVRHTSRNNAIYRQTALMICMYCLTILIQVAPLLTLISPWIREYIPSNMWNKITYPFINFSGCTFSLGMDKWFHPTLYWACDYLSMLGLKLHHVSKMARGWGDVCGYFLNMSMINRYSIQCSIHITFFAYNWCDYHPTVSTYTHTKYSLMISHRCHDVPNRRQLHSLFKYLFKLAF